MSFNFKPLLGAGLFPVLRVYTWFVMPVFLLSIDLSGVLLFEVVTPVSQENELIRTVDSIYLIFIVIVLLFQWRNVVYDTDYSGWF